LMAILFTINILVVVLRNINYIIGLAKGPYSKLKHSRETER